MDRFDISIIGGGVIGLAVARALSHDKRFTKRSIVILEQEDQFGQHVSSRNSEVIHAGIYYPQDSLKAQLCVRGKELLYEYCESFEVAHRRCGKLIVAGEGERQALESLALRAEGNGVGDLQFLTSNELKSLEPEVRADAALFSPSSGIIDSHGLMSTLLQQSEAAGVVFARNTRIKMIANLNQGFEIEAQIGAASAKSDYRFQSAAVINCAGLFAHEVLAMIHPQPEASQLTAGRQVLHFCKGDYFAYTGPLRLKHLVYPMPEANTVGLGIHATLDLGGQIRFGPDAEYVERLDYSIDAEKSGRFAAAIQRYLPDVKPEQLSPSYAGIRPKLTAPGEPAADFLIATGNGEAQDRQLHLLGIESPGLTSSLAIAELVAHKLLLD